MHNNRYLKTSKTTDTYRKWNKARLPVSKIRLTTIGWIEKANPLPDAQGRGLLQSQMKEANRYLGLKK